MINPHELQRSSGSHDIYGHGCRIHAPPGTKASCRHPSHMAHEFIVALQLPSLGQVLDVIVREGKALAGACLDTCREAPNGSD